eukprot:CAMPEP_0194366870 /NCGR_PEP_ID=MMETSP0174-20130528/14986_1 /TAXON_ID=216777 /ORGANISM="Proboscia alata, Strain PI-D3" /LENGTH=473 /DNA_ID=CAMNT_0039142357 /DNA_START=135 /DNA_END=1556 /DNA_ORIENTATION=+
MRGLLARKISSTVAVSSIRTPSVINTNNNFKQADWGGNFDQFERSTGWNTINSYSSNDDSSVSYSSSDDSSVLSAFQEDEDELSSVGSSALFANSQEDEEGPVVVDLKKTAAMTISKNMHIGNNAAYANDTDNTKHKTVADLGKAISIPTIPSYQRLHGVKLKQESDHILNNTNRIQNILRDRRSSHFDIKATFQSRNGGRPSSECNSCLPASVNEEHHLLLLNTGEAVAAASCAPDLPQELHYHVPHYTPPLPLETKPLRENPRLRKRSIELEMSMKQKSLNRHIERRRSTGSTATGDGFSSSEGAANISARLTTARKSSTVAKESIALNTKRTSTASSSKNKQMRDSSASDSKVPQQRSVTNSTKGSSSRSVLKHLSVRAKNSASALKEKSDKQQHATFVKGTIKTGSTNSKILQKNQDVKQRHVLQQYQSSRSINSTESNISGISARWKAMKLKKQISRKNLQKTVPSEK